MCERSELATEVLSLASSAHRTPRRKSCDLY